MLHRWDREDPEEERERRWTKQAINLELMKRSPESLSGE
jgi:hypothetical protein